VKKHVENKRFGKVVKVMASLARGVAADSVRATSLALICQPEEPKDLAKRLEAMEK